MHNLPIYNPLLKQIARREGHMPYVRVDLDNPYGPAGTTSLSEINICIAQIERHVDNVENVDGQYDREVFVDINSGLEFDSPAALIIALACDNAGLQRYEPEIPLYTCTYKREDTERGVPTHGETHFTWDQMVTLAFENSYYKLVPDEFTVQQLEVLKAVRLLRKKLSTSE